MHPGGSIIPSAGADCSNGLKSYNLSAKKKIFFVSCNGPKRIGQVGWYNLFFKFYYFLVQKCVFYAYFMLIGSWKGRKKLKGRCFFE